MTENFIWNTMMENIGEIFMGKSQTKSSSIDPAIGTSIHWGQDLRFSYKEQLFKVNKLFIIWLFALFLQAYNRLLGIMRE